VALLVAVALSGCGVGFGAGDGKGEARLTVSRDYGSQVLFEETVGPVRESSTVMRLLDGEADIETSYGGGFVDSIDGIDSSSGSRSFDWFYFVNGVAAERGAGEFVARPGDRIWWDYRDWTGAMEVNAVVGSFPAPLAGGYDGTEWPVEVVCLDAARACRIAAGRLSDAGVEFDLTGAGGAGAGSLRILVGTWRAVARDRDAAKLAVGPAGSGVFAGFTGSGPSSRLIGFDSRGAESTAFGPGVGLVAAMRRGSQPPLWLVTAAGAAGVEAAAGALEAGELGNRYAVAVSKAGVESLPTDLGGGGEAR